MNKYKELKNKHQEEVNNFSMFFAFNEKQFLQGCSQLGIDPRRKDLLITIGQGGFMLKTDYPKFEEMINRHADEMQAAIDEDKTGEGFIKDMFRYELVNHEYSYTRDISDAIYALDLTIDDINKSEKLIKGLHLAVAEALEEVI